MNNLKFSIPIADIVSLLPEAIHLVGDKSLIIGSFKPINAADPDSICFISADRKDANDLLKNTKAKAVILSEHLKGQTESDKTLLFVKDDPKTVFATILNKLIVRHPTPEVHTTAFIHPEAEIGKDVYIGPFVYIGKSSIGDGTVIYGSVFIYDNVSIGKNVVINAGTVIGAEGFGYVKGLNGKLENFPHIGGVLIEDEVEIGCNTCIDKGALGNTIIREGAKIDNLVHIAHNVVVGESAMVIADAMVGGSTEIGENSWIAPSSSLRDRIRIGSNVTVGMGAVVTKDIGEGEVWTGNPARPLKEFISISNHLKSLIKEL